jgi:hypothetical protein
MSGDRPLTYKLSNFARISKNYKESLKIKGHGITSE